MQFQRFAVDSIARKLRRCANIEDLRRVAERRLPGGVFGYIDGGAEVFQVYVWKDRGVVKEMIERAAAATYDAICITTTLPSRVALISTVSEPGESGALKRLSISSLPNSSEPCL